MPMPGRIVLTNGHLIDGSGGEPVSGASLVIAGSKIRQVIRDGESASADGDVRIDLNGGTIMPGLIDAHIHAGNIELTLDRTAALPPAVYVHRASRNLVQDLMMGFTTVRDAAGLDAGFKAAAAQGLIRAPRLFLSITPLAKGAQCPQDDALKTPAPRNSLGIYPEICRSPEDMAAAVRRTLKRGADQIKVFADGEVVSQDKADSRLPGEPVFTVEALAAAVQTAAAAGAYVMAHCYCPAAIKACVAAGVRSIEHGNLLDVETARLMAQQHTFLVPTLAIYDILTTEGRAAGLDRRSRAKLEQVARAGAEAVAVAWAAGVNIGSGADIIGPFQHLKGRELRLKADLMSPMAALVSATRTNAELMGIDNQLGTLETGKLADLIVLDRNPLVDMSLFEAPDQHVVLVIKNGVIEKNMISL